MENKNRTALALIAVVMMVAVAFVGFAVVSNEGSDAANTEYECSTISDINSKISSATGQITIKLSADIGSSTSKDGSSINVPEGKDVILDFNGKWIYSKASKTINNFGTLVIKDTADTHGGIKNDEGKYTIIKNFGQGKLTISDISVISTNTAEGGTRIAVKQDDSDKENGKVVAEDDRGYITINSGTFTAGQAVQAWGKVTINGGTFNGTVTAITYNGYGAGDITINGGTFNGNLLSVVWGANKDWPAEGSDSPSITIDSSKATLATGKKLSVGYTVNGSNIGTLLTTLPVDSMAIPTITVIGEDKFTTNAIASITDGAKKTYYAGLGDAMDCAVSGQTVMLEKDDSVSFNTEWDIHDVSGLTIDLNKKTVIDKNKAFVLQGKNFTVCNGTITCSTGGTSGSYAIFIGDEGETDDVTIKDVVTSGGVNIYNATNVKLEGMSFTGNTYYAVWCDEGGNVAIDGGTYSSAGVAVLGAVNEEFEASITINDGTFIVNGDQPLALQTYTHTYEDETTKTLDCAKPAIYGGFFYQTGTVSTKTLSLVDELNMYVADGYCVVGATVNEVSGYKIIPIDEAEASITVNGKTTYYATLEDAVAAANEASGNVTIEILKNVELTESGATNQASLWFTNTSGTIIINGNDYVITYNGAEADDTSRYNVIGFDQGVTATVVDLIIEGNDKARNGMNIYRATSISLEDVVVKNVKVAGIVANSDDVKMKNCDVIEDCPFGVNVDVGSSGATTCALTIEGDFSGFIWSESKQGVIKTITYSGVVAILEMKAGTVWFSPDYDFWKIVGISSLAGDFTIYGDVEISKGKAVVIDDNIKFEIGEGKTLTLQEGATITGKIVGHDENSVVVDGLKAGSNGIKFTSGSLRIDGDIVSEGTTAGVTVRIVSGDNVIISGQLKGGATMVIEEGTTVTIESGQKFTSSGTITNNGSIVNNGTLKVTDEATVTGNGIVNTGIIADKRTSGTAVPIDTGSTGTVVVTEDNASAYDESTTKLIVETDKITSGTVTSDTNEYIFVDEVTTTGNLKVIMNDGYKQYTITIPKGTTISEGAVFSVEYISSGTNSVVYEIETDGVTGFSVKLPTLTGFKSAKVYCDGLTDGISNVKYNASSGYVTFDSEHNSTFMVVLSYAEPSPDTSSDVFDKNAAFIGAIVVLVVAILALAVVIKRK